jgi:ATP-binding cassette subfamily B protein
MFKDTLGLFYKYIFKYKKSYLISFILLVLARIAFSYSNFFFKYFIDALPGFNVQTIISLLSGLIAIRLISSLLDIISDFIGDIYTIGSARDIRTAIFGHLHDLDYSFHASRRSGSLISIMKRGDGAVFSINGELNRNLPRIIVDFIFIMITFTVIDKKLMLIVLIMVILNLLIAQFLVRRNITRRKILNDEEDVLSGIIVDNMINYETVKYFAAEEKEKNRIKAQYKKWTSAMWGYANTFRLIDITTSILSVAGIGLVIYVSILETAAGQLTIGDFVLIVTFIGTFFPKLNDIIYRFREIAKHQTDLELYLQLLLIPVEIKEAPDALELKHIKGEIEFSNVNFKYKKRTNTINGFNLKIAPGESVAFVGESGAGKTTLTRLMLRFYNLDNGEILIDGHDISKITKHSLRRSIGVVQQEPILFNDTIAYNISYGKDGATPAEIEAAAKIANLDEFIGNLPKKYDTLVGERGIKLSGGQKQRLAIARMFLENPPVIIFDEATSQLDSVSEKLIQDAFWKVAHNHTTIIIAHRLSTVMRSDRIVVMQDGKIAETGTHEQLLNKQGGIYTYLWKLQSLARKEEPLI